MAERLIIETVRRNDFHEDVYIRPSFYKSTRAIGVRLHDLDNQLYIIALPFGNYIDTDSGVRVMTSSWRRNADEALPARGKIVGGYVNMAFQKTEAELNERNIRTVRDLRGLEVAQLSEWFGRWGEDLHAKARGLSDSVVSNEWEPKSVGEQETFEVNTLDADFILQRVRALAAEVFGRLQRQGFRACRTVTITVRFAHFRTLTRSHTSRDEIASEEALYAGAAQLLAPFFDARENPRGTKIRLIGVRAEKLQR